MDLKRKTLGKLRPDVAVPLTLSFITLVVSAFVFLDQRSRIETRLVQEARLVGSSFAARLETHLNVRLKAGMLLGQRLIVNESIDVVAFRTETALMHDLFEDFQALNWVDSQGVIQIVTPEDGNAAALGLDLRQLPIPAQALASAESTQNMQVTPPIELAQGGSGFAAYVPIRGDSDRSGFLNIVFRSTPLIDNVLAEGSERAYAYKITDGGEAVYLSSQTAASSDLFNQIGINVGGREWTLQIAPTSSRVQEVDTLFDEAILCLGLLIAVLSGVMSRLVITRQNSMDQVEARLRDITNNIDDIVWVNSPDFSETLYINPAFEKIFGLKLEDLRKDLRSWTNVIVPEDAEKLWKTIEGIVEKVKSGDQAQIDRFEYPIYKVKSPDGITRDIYARSVAMKDADGNIERFVGVATDVSQLLQAQKDLRLSNEQLLQAQKMEAIGQLTGGVAHDFNNLLAVILGNLELIDETDDPEEIQSFVSAAKTATHRGADLTKSLLSFARQSRLEPAVIEINQMVKEIETWSSRVVPETIDIEVSLLAGLWRAEADPSLTQNALLNLILNARDAMPNGGKLTIETSNVRIDEEYNDYRGEDIEPGRYVMLAVSDTGEGISNENLANIFDPFFTTKAVGMGSGLGLSMVQGFLKQSGGAVRVYSEQGVGTTFKLYFKAAGGKQHEHARQEPAVVPQSKDGIRIFAVEDEEAVLTVLKETLKKAGYEVTSARSGDEAMRIWSEDSDYDLLVTDIVMPGELQGTQLARALRELRPDLPVVFMSGYASEATVHGNGLRPEDVRLMKPVRRVDLLAAVEKALRLAN